MDKLLESIEHARESIEHVRETNAKAKEILQKLLTEIDEYFLKVGVKKIKEDITIDDMSYVNSLNSIVLVQSRKRRGWRR